MVEKRRELTQDEIQQLKSGNEALMKRVKIEASAVVRGANGNIVYDNPDNIGNYNEETLK